MGGPAWLTAIFAAASLAVAVYCAGRLAAARRWQRPTELDTDGAHVVMGVAMAGMLLSGLRTLPSTIWEVVFAAGAAWFGYRMLQARRGAQPSPWRSSHPLPRTRGSIRLRLRRGQRYPRPRPRASLPRSPVRREI